MNELPVNLFLCTLVFLKCTGLCKYDMSINLYLNTEVPRPNSLQNTVSPQVHE